MTDKFRIFCRTSGVWSIEAKQSKHQTSLLTRDEPEAHRILHARNEAHRHVRSSGAAAVRKSKMPAKFMTTTWYAEEE
jgi:hypothetical protein